MSSPLRRGHSVSLTLTYDALQTLRRLAPGQKSLGHFVSTLILSEEVRRETRAQERQRLVEQAPEPAAVG